MQLMITNKGPTPLPIGTGEDGGQEGLLPPGLEQAVSRPNVAAFVVGERDDPVGRNKFEALAVDPESPLALEYATDIDQWKGRSDPLAESAEMQVTLAIKNVGYDPVTVTTAEGPTVLEKDSGILVQTLGGCKIEGADGSLPPDANNPDTPDPGDLTGTISSFTAANPTEVTTDLQDQNMVGPGTILLLEALTGDPDAMALLDSQMVTVLSVAPTTLDLDLSAADVTGLTADFSIIP